eukprot:14302014-Ditylum_brightwellii.AAC.1
MAEELREAGNTVGHNGDARTNNLSDDISDYSNRDLYEFDWLDADANMMITNDSVGSDDVQIQWDKNHD